MTSATKKSQAPHQVRGDEIWDDGNRQNCSRLEEILARTKADIILTRNLSLTNWRQVLDLFLRM
jgi:hypothetical protein